MTQAPASNPTLSPAPGGNAIQGQAARYALLSVISFIGNLGLTVLLHEWLGLSAYLAVPLAMVSMTVFNFFTIRFVVFTESTGGLPKQFAGFIASIAGFRAAEYVGFVVLHGLFTVAYLPACAAMLAASAVCKFLFLRSVVFTSPRDTDTPEARP